MKLTTRAHVIPRGTGFCPKRFRRHLHKSMIQILVPPFSLFSCILMYGGILTHPSVITQPVKHDEPRRKISCPAYRVGRKESVVAVHANQRRASVAAPRRMNRRGSEVRVYTKRKSVEISPYNKTLLTVCEKYKSHVNDWPNASPQENCLAHREFPCNSMVKAFERCGELGHEFESHDFLHVVFGAPVLMN